MSVIAPDRNSHTAGRDFVENCAVVGHDCGDTSPNDEMLVVAEQLRRHERQFPVAQSDERWVL